LAVKNDNFKESNYSNIMYFFPYNDNCWWGGRADVGSLTSNDNQTYESWINGTTSFYTKAHELGHNFGTRHAASYTCYDKNKNTVSISDDCDFSEYGDPFDVMGTGNSSAGSPYHTSSFNKTQTGWLDSQNVQNVEENGTFTLFPIEQKSSNIQAIKIPRGTYSESTEYDDYYFLEYRQHYGYDVFDQEGDKRKPQINHQGRDYRGTGGSFGRGPRDTKERQAQTYRGINGTRVAGLDGYRPGYRDTPRKERLCKQVDCRFWDYPKRGRF